MNKYQNHHAEWRKTHMILIIFNATTGKTNPLRRKSKQRPGEAGSGGPDQLGRGRRVSVLRDIGSSVKIYQSIPLRTICFLCVNLGQSFLKSTSTRENKPQSHTTCFNIR